MKENNISDNIDRIQDFVGDVNPDQLINVESFIGKNVAVFIPSTGHCFYSISKDHTHPSFSFYYSYNKKIKMSVNSKIVRSRPGYISSLFPGVKHQEIPAENFMRFIAVFIDKDFLLKNVQIYKKDLTVEMISYIKLPEQFLPCVKNFMIETSDKKNGSENMIDAIEMQLVHHLLRAAFSIKDNSTIISGRDEIDFIVEYINDHYADRINLEDLAAKAALSKSHFSRIFKKETGYTMQDYVLKVRIDRAKLLLCRGNAKITEIAYKCGFSSSAHFTSTFLKHVGIQPSIYRKDLFK